MLDTGLPHEDEEKYASVSPPLSSHYASRSSTPGLSSLDGTPRYLFFPPNLPRSGSNSPPPATDMAINQAACLLEPNSRPSHGQITLQQVSSGQASSATMQPPHGWRGSGPEQAVPTSDRYEEVTLLSEISHLLRLQKYNKRKCVRAQESLRSLQIAAAKTARLHRSARSVQQTLSECIRSEDKGSFASLLHAFQDACDDATKPASAAQGTATGHTKDVKPAATFLDCLSTSSKRAILDVFAKVRHDGTFLANRLTSLGHKELTALLPDRFISRSNESIFSASSKTVSGISKPLGFTVDSQVESLASSSYDSPLETLVFAPAALPHTNRAELERLTDVWATACAKLICDQKPGSERLRLIPALLDIWSGLCPWPGKDRLESWIFQTLRQGAFLLEQSGKQTFRARVEGRSDMSAMDEAKTDAFYSAAAESLLDLLADQTAPSAIPPGVMILCHAISGKLEVSPDHRRALPSFILTRWLVSSFLMNLVNTPETYTLLTDHYVSDLSRQRILKPVALRAQRIVFDVVYSWKHGSTTPQDSVDRINALNSRLQGATQMNFPDAASLPENAQSDKFLAVTMTDAIDVISALYPRRRPASVLSDKDTAKSGLLSSASSMSGFSLFRNADTPPQSSSALNLLPSQLRNLDVTNSDASALAVYDQAANAYNIREALFELDELASRRASSTKEFWEILCDNAYPEQLTTFREKVTAVRNSAPLPLQMTELADLSVAELSVARSVEILLQEYGSSSSENAATRTQPLPQIWKRLEQTFESAVQDSQDKSDFVGAQQWFQKLQAIHEMIFRTNDYSALHRILLRLENDARKSISQSTNLETACNDWEASLPVPGSLHNLHLKPALEIIQRLRDKMWYVADVRTSAVYDDARSIANVLRIMAAPKRAAKVRGPPTLRHWTTSRTSSANLHAKSEAQILDIISSRIDQGGPNKLSDEQARLTAQWMQRDNIDNLCRGEERLHKLCMEILKCVNHITNASATENTMLWSSLLFARDDSVNTLTRRRTTFLPSLYGDPSQHGHMYPGGQPRSNETLSSTSYIMSTASSREFTETRSPTLTNSSSVPFWSPTTSELDTPSSATSIFSSNTHFAADQASYRQRPSSPAVNPQCLEKLRQRMTSLLLSDLTSALFTDGSETDKAFWTGLGAELTERHFRTLVDLPSSIGSQTPTADASTPLRSTRMRFSFDHAFGVLLQRLSGTCNPSVKLACLYDIDRLLVPYMAERDLESSTFQPFSRTAGGSGSLMVQSASNDATETSIRGFRDIFSRKTLRPVTIFRDLQFIAALLPSTVLQGTPQGKAFCNAAVAMAGLKSEARKIMVETAADIIAFHSNNRGHGQSSSTAQQQRDHAIFPTPSPPAEDIGRYSMADAAYLLQITAKEGDPVAQRELATLYLTHPELMDRIIAPFSRPKEVFKEEIEGRWKRNQDPNRCDPNTMCVAHHWMSLSSKGGDALAKEYLRQREEMNSF